MDERPTSAGKAAGDVYVLALGVSGNSNALLLVACSDALKCGQAAAIPGPASPTGFEFMRVRGDGLITISFANLNADGSDDILFVTCTPNGAPAAPTCAAPTLALHVAQPINSGFVNLFPLANVELLMFTYPKHASRAEAGGKFTTFLTYEDCKTSFQNQNPPVSICVNSEVMLVNSTDNGKTWSTPVAVDNSAGQHFYPAIATDSSTGFVDLAYYSTQGDSFKHEVHIVRSQILPGTTTPTKPQAMTTLANAIDVAPQRINQSQSDFFLGVVARGSGVSGQSHMYTSFDSSAVPGNYNGRPLPELNNHLSMIAF